MDVAGEEGGRDGERDGGVKPFFGDRTNASRYAPTLRCQVRAISLSLLGQHHSQAYFELPPWVPSHKAREVAMRCSGIS